MSNDNTLNEQLLKAVKKGNLLAVKNLLEQKADKNTKDANGFTPLHLAVLNNRLGIVETLLEEDANKEAQDINGFTPLHLAAKNGRSEIARRLLEKDANKEAQDINGFTPLHLAAKNGYLNAVKRLLEKDANKEAKTGKAGGTPLHLAAANGKLEVVRELLNKKANKEATNISGNTPLHSAAENGHSEVVRALLNKKANKEATNKLGNTPLRVAIEKKYLELVEILLMDEAYKEAKTDDHFTLLHYAAQKGYLDVVETLLNAGADIDANDFNNYTPLRYAAANERLDVVEKLLEKGANIDASDFDNYTPLHYAAANGRLNVVEVLLKFKANKEATNKSDNTPLHLAAKNGHFDVVEKLLEVGENIEAKDKNGYTPLHYAAEEGHRKVVETLLEEKADKNAKDSYGSTPLHIAAENNHRDVVKALLNAGANKEAKDIFGKTALDWAEEGGHTEVVTALRAFNVVDNAGRSALSITQNSQAEPLNPLQQISQTQSATKRSRNSERANEEAEIQPPAKKQKPNSPDATNILLATAEVLPASTLNEQLLEAVREGKSLAVQDLIQQRADIEAKTTAGATPLHIAAFKGHLKIVKALLEKKADIEAKTAKGLVPLHIAAQKGHLEVVRELLDKKAEIEAKTSNDATPLHCAADKGQLEIVEKLLEEGAKIEAKTAKDFTPLHYAAENGHLDVVRKLLEKKADIEAKTSNSTTPLHYAAGKGHLEIVKALLEKKADIEAKTAKGLVPLHIAAQKGHLEVVRELLDKKAEIEAKTSNDATPLHCAANKGQLEIVKKLLEEGAKIEAKTAKDFTPLHIAAQNGHLDVVRELLDKKAKIEAKTAFGLTPLHCAAQNNHRDVGIALLNAGANKDVKDIFGKTPLNRAEEEGHTEVVTALRAPSVVDDAGHAEPLNPLQQISQTQLATKRSRNSERANEEAEQPPAKKQKPNSPETTNTLLATAEGTLATHFEEELVCTNLQNKEIHETQNGNLIQVEDDLSEFLVNDEDNAAVRHFIRVNHGRKYENRYDRTTLEYLTFSGHTHHQVLRYVFSLANQEDQFLREFIVLDKIAAMTQKPVCFISHRPANNSNYHMICGLLYESQLLLIDPKGLPDATDACYPILATLKSEIKLKEIYLSGTKIQRDDVSSGVICIELMHYFASLNPTELKDIFYKSLAAFKAVKSENLAEKGLYTVAIDSLLKDELRQLLLATLDNQQETYQSIMKQIRSKHYHLLLNNSFLGDINSLASGSHDPHQVAPGIYRDEHLVCRYFALNTDLVDKSQLLQAIETLATVSDERLTTVKAAYQRLTEQTTSQAYPILTSSENSSFIFREPNERRFLLLDKLKKGNYTIGLPAQDSSGDIYHVLAYLLLAEAGGCILPKVRILYDNEATKKQAERSKKLAQLLSFNELQIEEAPGESNRSNAREKRLRLTYGKSNLINQKATTSLLVKHALEYTRDKTVAIIRKGFLNRITANQKIQKEIEKIKQLIKGQIEIIKNHYDNSSSQGIVLLHKRHSQAANKEQNFAAEVENCILDKLSQGNIFCWTLLCTSEDLADPPNTFNIFNNEDMAEDYKKIYHILLLDALLALPDLIGMIGNTSGLLDMASFMGMNILNVHNFFAGKRYKDQEYRILSQYPFMSILAVDKVKEDYIKDVKDQLNIWLKNHDEIKIFPSFFSENKLKQLVYRPSKKTYAQDNERIDFSGYIAECHETTGNEEKGFIELTNYSIRHIPFGWFAELDTKLLHQLKPQEHYDLGPKRYEGIANLKPHSEWRMSVAEQYQNRHRLFSTLKITEPTTSNNQGVTGFHPDGTSPSP